MENVNQKFDPEVKEQMQAIYSLIIAGCNIFLMILLGLTILLAPLILMGMNLGYITRNSDKYRNLALIGLISNTVLLVLILLLALYNLLIIIFK